MGCKRQGRGSRGSCQPDITGAHSKDPQFAARIKQLAQIRKQQASLSLSVPRADEQDLRKAELAKLARAEEAVSRELAKAGSQKPKAEAWIELDDVRKNLPAGSVLVNIARFRNFDFHAKDKENRWQAEHYAAWIIPPASQQPVKLIDLGLAESIDREVAAFRVAIAEAGRPKTGTIAQHGLGTAEHFLSAPLNRLSQRILHPLLREIGAAEEFIVSPDSNLWLVPWYALLLPDKRYAIEQYAIRHLISGRELATDVVSRSNKGPLILADPDFDSHPLEIQTAGASDRARSKASCRCSEKRCVFPSLP